MADRVPVEPMVLEWARASAGLDVSAAAKKLAVSENSIAKWEAGELQPTIKQLRKAASAYRRPLAVLLLPSSPADFDALRDFRRLTGAGGGTWSPELHAEFKRALSQREVFLELAEFAPSVIRDGGRRVSIEANTSVDDAATLLRDLLRVTTVDWSQPHDVLNAFISAIEALGIIVIQTKGVELKEMRAFSVSEWPFPVIALNGKDWPRPRLFSLLHELTHVALNAGGLCDLHEARQHRAPEDELEHYCNGVAGAILMPRDRMLSEASVREARAGHDWSLAELADLSRTYGASSEAVLLRLVGLGKASWELYRRRQRELDKAYAEARERQKETQRASSGGPSFYVVKARDLGHGYVAGVLGAFEARAISSLDVADYLEVRYDQLPKLEEVVRR